MVNVEGGSLARLVRCRCGSGSVVLVSGLLWLVVGVVCVVCFFSVFSGGFFCWLVGGVFLFIFWFMVSTFCSWRFEIFLKCKGFLGNVL